MHTKQVLKTLHHSVSSTRTVKNLNLEVSFDSLTSVFQQLSVINANYLKLVYIGFFLCYPRINSRNKLKFSSCGINEPLCLQNVYFAIYPSDLISEIIYPAMFLRHTFNNSSSDYLGAGITSTCPQTQVKHRPFSLGGRVFSRFLFCGRNSRHKSVVTPIHHHVLMVSVSYTGREFLPSILEDPIHCIPWYTFKYRIS